MVLVHVEPLAILDGADIGDRIGRERLPVVTRARQRDVRQRQTRPVHLPGRSGDDVTIPAADDSGAWGGFDRPRGAVVVGEPEQIAARSTAHRETPPVDSDSGGGSDPDAVVWITRIYPDRRLRSLEIGILSHIDGPPESERKLGHVRGPEVLQRNQREARHDEKREAGSGHSGHGLLLVGESSDQDGTPSPASMQSSSGSTDPSSCRLRTRVPCRGRIPPPTPAACCSARHAARA
jgi:hypothetical protein